MVPVVAAAVIGGMAMSAFSAASTKRQTEQLAQAYREAADQVRSAAKKYSGKNAYDAITATGRSNANDWNKRALASQLKGPGNESVAMANNANLRPDYESGYNLGQNMAEQDLNARYNAETAKAQQFLGQAQTNYKAQQAMTQGGLQAAQDLAKIGGQVYSEYGPQISSYFKNRNVSTPTMEPASTSDERQKEGINNNSGLPPADIEDSLRQLETVEYKYKNPDIPGCDDRKHVGFTAQSLEKTPLGKDAVQEGEDGIKRVDQWQLREALLAGMAQLQREIDELSAVAPLN